MPSILWFFKWVSVMIEILLTLGLSAASSSVLGRQSFITTNQVGQIKYSNAYGHCLNWDGSKFYQIMGAATRSGSNIPNLFVYEIDSNVWTNLGTIPSGLGTNSYWSIAPIDDDHLLATCRTDRGIYTISTATWEVLAKGPTGDSNMYGSKMHPYKNKIFNVGDAAAASVMSAGIYDIATKVTSNGGASGQRLGTYSCTVRCNDKIYGFPGLTQSYGRVQIYDLRTGTFSFSEGNVPFRRTFSEGYAYGDLIYLFGGSGDSTGWDTVNVYNTLTDTWSTAPSMKRKNMQPQCFMNRGKMYIWGGNETGTQPVYDDFITYEMGIDIPQFGPGPRDIYWGDLEQGYYGEIPKGKFMGIGTLRNLSGLNIGTNDLTWDGKWHKMSLFGKVVYVPSAGVATGFSYNNLKDKGIDQGKLVYHNGCTYLMRLVNMADSNTWPVTSNFTAINTSENIMNSEWGKITGGLLDPTSVTVGRKWGLVPSTQLVPTDKWIHARQIRNGNPTQSIVLDNTRYSFNDVSTPSTIGWYPVLELVEETAAPAPKAIVGDYNLRTKGPLKYAFSSQYIDGKIYSFSGFGSVGVLETAMNVYDIDSDSWSIVNGINTPPGRYGYGCCVHDGKYWIFGGRTATDVYSDIHVYDPKTNTWTAKGNLPAARYYIGIGVYNGKFYLHGGYNGSTQTGETLEYDPVDGTFTTKATGPVTHGHGTAVIGNKMYSLGGLVGSSSPMFYEYDLLNNTWSQLANMPSPAYYMGTAVRNGKLYRYGGGNISGTATATLFEYNPITLQWRQLNTGPFTSTLLGMVDSPEGIWIYGGYNGTASLGTLYLIT